MDSFFAACGASAAAAAAVVAAAAAASSAGAAGAAGMDVPHDVQNFAVSESSLPQLGHFIDIYLLS